MELFTKFRAVFEASVRDVVEDDDDPDWSICDMDEGSGTPSGDELGGNERPGLPRPGRWGVFIAPAAMTALSNCSGGRP